MAKPADILVVDDDRYTAKALADVLADYGGYEVQRAGSVDAALELLERVPFRLVIVDLRMPPGSHFDDLETEGGHKTGLAVARWLHKQFPAMKVIVHTGGLDREAEARLVDSDCVKFLYKSPDPKPLLRIVKQVLGLDEGRPRPFIVHGHDHGALFALKDYLQNRLGFAEPIVLAQMPSSGRTVVEKFEQYAAMADMVFVLLTPDDAGHAVAGGEQEQARARQNAIFELGYFLGYLRRQSGRVLVLRKGPIEIPSDLAGVVTIDISGGIEAAGEEIRRETAALTAGKRA
jgi:predicted nucleotide-binding protein